MKVTWKPQTKKPTVSSQKPWVLKASLSASLAALPGIAERRCFAIPARLSRRSYGKRDHDQREAGKHEHRRMPVVETILQDRGKRHDRELPERAAGGGDAERKRSLCSRSLPSDGAEDRSKTRRRHADARKRVAEREHHAFVRQRDNEHAAT